MKPETGFHSNPSINQEIMARLERLSRQTCLSAVETTMDALEDENYGLERYRSAQQIKAVAKQMVRATLEMAHALRAYEFDCAAEEFRANQQ